MILDEGYRKEIQFFSSKIKILYKITLIFFQFFCANKIFNFIFASFVNVF